MENNEDQLELYLKHIIQQCGDMWIEEWIKFKWNKVLKIQTV